MLKSHAAALKLSEIREKLNDLNAVAEPTDAQKTEERELLATQKATETEYREALTAESEAETHETTRDPEVRERLELRRTARLGAFILAHLQGREPTGPEAEYRSALGVTGGIPVDLFEREPEIRADAASVAPGTGTGATLAADPAGAVRAQHRAAAGGSICRPWEAGRIPRRGSQRR